MMPIETDTVRNARSSAALMTPGFKWGSSPVWA